MCSSTSQYRNLWCGCNGDPNGTHRDDIIDRELDKFHEGASRNMAIYVSLVLTLYLSAAALLYYSSGQGCG